MIILMLVLAKFVHAERSGSACDLEINEGSQTMYHSKIINFNSSELKYVKQMEILQYNDIFAIDSHNLELQTIRKIDRDHLCKQHKSCDCSRPVCLIKIKILIIYLSFTNNPPHQIDKNICITDSNDNKPTFPESAQNLDLNENADVGTVFDLHSASDLDSEKFGVVRYTLECPFDILNLSYKISQQNSHRSDHRVRVTTKKKVQFKPDLTICNISACDIDQCTTIKLIVKINDVNDHRPQWKETIYYRSLNENTLHDSVIDRFEAVDPDPVYGKITYSIGRILLPLDPKASVDALFIIDSSTGELRVNKNLDYEESSFRKIEVILVAKDNGSPILSSSSTVQISLKNVNDNPPSIRLNKASIDIKENSDPIFLDFFTVTDEDEMEVDKVTCTVLDPENLFRLKRSSFISPILFEIYSITSFDYEKQSMVMVVIRCEDGGDPLLSTIKRITVNILDLNDNIVYFPHKVIHVHISENVPIGTEVTKLVAADLDRRSNLLYSLVNPRNCSYVNIDSYHGYMTTNEAFDRESQEMYNFLVKVEERDYSNFSDTAEVFLRITDTNDNSPHFKEHYTFNLTENVSINTFIGKVQASDPDSGCNGTITYYYGASSGKNNEYFRVGSNGEIRLFKQLDFESQTVHNLVIVARDQGNAVVLSSSTSVIIRVLDSNDHPPRFEERTTSLNLPCQSQDVGKDLIAVSDKDQSPENIIIKYEIEKIEPAKFKSVFSINESTGFITMTPDKDQCKFKYTSREKIDITLRVFDPTKTEFKDRANLIIYLENDKYDRHQLNNKLKKNDGTRFSNNKQRPAKIDADGVNRSEDFIDQNVVIVMILIFITIFLGIILISLVCFIKRRRQSENEQDVSEGLGMIREKVNPPIEPGKYDYRKNFESYNLTMKNIGANAGYYQTMSDQLTLKTNENHLSQSHLKNTLKTPENTTCHYDSSNATVPNAYHTLTMNPRTDEQYSMMESFVINSMNNIKEKSQLEFINEKTVKSTNNSGNRQYVSVSFV